MNLLPSDDLVASQINAQVFGAVLLILFGCGVTMNGGYVADHPKRADGSIITFHYLTHFYIQVDYANDKFVYIQRKCRKCLIYRRQKKTWSEFRTDLNQTPPLLWQ